MKLTKTQDNAVNKLLNLYNQNQKEVLFNAPTGSGKTFMIANFISKIIESNQHDKLLFVIATISSSELPLQFSNKLKMYNPYLPVNLDVEYKQSPSKSKIKTKDYEPSLVAKKNKVFVLGKSSFTKSSIFIERGIFDGFIEQIKNENYKLIYIRDEAHHGGTKTKSKNNYWNNFEEKIREVSAFVLEMSASPKQNLENKVLINEKDLENDEGKYLLKTNLFMNKGISKSKIKDINDLDFLEIALNEFIESKKKYLTMNSEINPAMLIQVDSKTQKNLDHFDEELEKIKSIIEAKGLTWYQYFSDEKNGSTKETMNLEKISKNNSTIDVIIFKIGPATGWDIPRANFLLQLRNINSETLNIQTIGRIKRNPNKDLSKNEITDKYYIYSNYQPSSRILDTYIPKNKHEEKTFYSGELKTTDIDGEKLKTKFNDWFNGILDNEKKKTLWENYYDKHFTNNMSNQPILIESTIIRDDSPQRIRYYKKEIRNLIDLRIFIITMISENIQIFNVIMGPITNYASKYNLEEYQLIFSLYSVLGNEIKATFSKFKNEVE